MLPRHMFSICRTVEFMWLVRMSPQTRFPGQITVIGMPYVPAATQASFSLAVFVAIH